MEEADVVHAAESFLASEDVMEKTMHSLLLMTPEAAGEAMKTAMMAGHKDLLAILVILEKEPPYRLVTLLNSYLQTKLMVNKQLQQQKGDSAQLVATFNESRANLLEELKKAKERIHGGLKEGGVGSTG